MLDEPGTLTGLSDPSESPFTYDMKSKEGFWRGLITEVMPLEGTRVSLAWSGGIQEELDLMPALLGARIHDRLGQDRKLFATVRTGIHGSVLEWADGTILSARSVAVVAELHMTNVEFREAMRLLGMSYSGMAAHLGLSESQIGNFRRDRPVPNHIALAVRYLLRLRLDRYREQPLA